MQWRLVTPTSTINLPMSLFKDHFRIESTRLPGWDYGFGRYFVTICTKHREPYFGHIQNGIMCLSDAGSIVMDEWERISVDRSSVTLDRRIAMPDHMHGIIVIGCRDAMPRVAATNTNIRPAA